MVWWHHRHNVHGFGRTPGVGDGQGGQGCCGSWDRKDSDTTEQLNWNCVCAHSVAHLCPTMGRQLYKTGIKEQKKNHNLYVWWASLVMSLPAVRETWVQSLLGRSPGEGNGNPLQYSCLENPMEWGPWQAAVYGVAESDMTERLHSHLWCDKWQWEIHVTEGGWG